MCEEKMPLQPNAILKGIVLKDIKTREKGERERERERERGRQGERERERETQEEKG